MVLQRLFSSLRNNMTHEMNDMTATRGSFTEHALTGGYWWTAGLCLT